MVRIKILNIWYSAYRFFDTPVISRIVDIANISYDFTTSNTGAYRAAHGRKHRRANYGDYQGI